MDLEFVPASGPGLLTGCVFLPLPGEGFPEVPGLFSLPFLPKFVAGVFLLVDEDDFDVAFADEHAVFGYDHLGKLGWNFNNCLPRKLPILKDQTQSVRFDIESLGFNQLLDDFVL